MKTLYLIMSEYDNLKNTWAIVESHDNEDYTKRRLRKIINNSSSTIRYFLATLNIDNIEEIKNNDQEKDLAKLKEEVSFGVYEIDNDFKMDSSAPKMIGKNIIIDFQNNEARYWRKDKDTSNGLTYNDAKKICEDIIKKSVCLTLKKIIKENKITTKVKITLDKKVIIGDVANYKG